MKLKIWHLALVAPLVSSVYFIPLLYNFIADFGMCEGFCMTIDYPLDYILFILIPISVIFPFRFTNLNRVAAVIDIVISLMMVLMLNNHMKFFMAAVAMRNSLIFKGSLKKESIVVGILLISSALFFLTGLYFLLKKKEAENRAKIAATKN